MSIFIFLLLRKKTIRKDIEHMTPENKHLILETDDSALIDCTVQSMEMLNKDLQKRIVDRISVQTKKEETDDPEQEQELTKEPDVPPSKMVSAETQTDFPEEFEKAGSSQQREEPVSSVGSQQREVTEEKKDISADDTAPKEKPVTLEYYGMDISGNEKDSVLRRLKECFKDEYHDIWAGFYNQGFPAMPQSRHVMWHKHFRKTNEPHQDYWYQDSEDNVMTEYIRRHYNKSVFGGTWRSSKRCSVWMFRPQNASKRTWAC